MDIWLLVGIFVILDLALITFVIVAKSRKGFSESEKRRFSEHWQRILLLDGRHAVMEADKLLDEILGKKGYRGSLGEKLKKAGPAFTNANDVWAAHKLRNRLAHELDARITGDEARRALKQLERAYKDLGLKL